MIPVNKKKTVIKLARKDMDVNEHGRLFYTQTQFKVKAQLGIYQLKSMHII
jgi:hypothetical protein